MFNFFSKHTYRVGVALGGGGARGFAHAGALKAMEECGIRPDIIAGVSAGSVVAVMYASGMTPDAIAHSFDGHKFNDLCEWRVPTSGLLTMDGFKKFIRETVKVERLEQLDIPVMLGATDFEKGESVIFDSGEIGDRVAASCSIPMVFQPQVIDGVKYVDGGVLHNLPARDLRPLCKYLIGINVSPLRTRAVKHQMLDTAMRSYELVTKTNTRADMAVCDLAISMDSIADYKVFNLKETDRVFKVGYMNMMELLTAHGFRPRK